MFSNIQILRAFAAIMVVFQHALPHYEAMHGSSSLFKSISLWGFTGVDIFFVISGFVIAHTTLSKEKNISNCIEFLKHRFSRIYLGYWPFFIAFYLVYLIFLPTGLKNINIFDSFLLINTNMNELILPVSWTLCYELYFYGIFAVLFTVRSEIVKIILPTLFLALILRSIYLPISQDSMFSFLLSHYLIEFLSGTLLYIYQNKLKGQWIIPLGISLTAIAYYYGMQINATNGPHRVFTFGVASFSLVMTALILEKRRAYQGKNYLAALGDSSYTLYLSHLLLLQLFYFTGIRTALSSHGPWMVEVGFLSFIAFCLLFSHIFYLYIEFPIYKIACGVKFWPVKHDMSVLIGHN